MAAILAIVATVAAIAFYFGSLGALVFWLYTLPIPFLVVVLVAVDYVPNTPVLTILELKKPIRQWLLTLWASLGTYLPLSSAVLAWPGFGILLYRKFRERRKIGVAQNTLRSQIALMSELMEQFEYVGALSTAFMSSVWFLLAVSNIVSLKFSAWLMYVFLFSVMTRLAGVFWVEGGLLSELKRTPGHPLLKFVIVALSDLVTVTLALTTISATSLGQHLSWLATRQTVTHLLTLNVTLTSLAKSGMHPALAAIEHFSAAQLIYLAAGSLMYFVIIQSALKGLSQFKRNDSEHLAVSKSLTAQGTYQQAVKQLEQLEIKSVSREARIFPLLAAGKIDKAAEAADADIRDDVTVESVVQEEDVLFLLFSYARTLPIEVRFKIWERAVSKKVLESLLALMIVSYRLNPELKAKIESGGFTPEVRMASIISILFNGQVPNNLESWFPPDLVIRTGDHFGYICLELVTKLAKSKGPEEGKQVLADWWQNQADQTQRASDELLNLGPWAHVVCSVFSVEVYQIARDCSSVHAAWWKELTERSALLVERYKPLKGYLNMMKKIEKDEFTTQGWFE